MTESIGQLVRPGTWGVERIARMAVLETLTDPVDLGREEFQAAEWMVRWSARTGTVGLKVKNCNDYAYTLRIEPQWFTSSCTECLRTPSV
jgi:hypothetical protein